MLSFTNSLCLGKAKDSKSSEDLGKAKDVTKQVEFESSTIRNINDQK